jgi:hypothetical protein
MHENGISRTPWSFALGPAGAHGFVSFVLQTFSVSLW